MYINSSYNSQVFYNNYPKKIRISKNLPCKPDEVSFSGENKLYSIIYEDLVNTPKGLNFNEPLSIVDALNLICEEPKLTSGIASCKKLIKKSPKDLERIKDEFPKVKKY